MATKDKGTKHTCQSCSAIFYDLKRKPITCPKCGTKVETKPLLKPRRNLTQITKPSEKGPDSVSDVETEIKNLDVDIEVEVDDKDDDDLIEDMSDMDDDADMSEVKEHISTDSDDKD